MNSIRVSDAARADLDEIWLYIARDNPEATDRYIRTVVARFPLLASMPLMGRPREELSPRLRSLSVGRHIIFYRPGDNGLDIARVLDGARDLPPLFE